MSAEQFVVLGLARVRAAWFRDISRWSNAGSLPVQFVKCVSADEVRTRLDGGRPFSALLIDGSLPALDRDLVDRAREHGCSVFVVDDGSRSRPWVDLDVSCLVHEPVDRDSLLSALHDHARPLSRVDIELADDTTAPDADAESSRGRIVAVTGAGGSGSTTTAMAVAQGLAATSAPGTVLLADLALHADQAMLHGAAQLVPGVQELVEAHRFAAPDATGVRALTFECTDRGYDLLLGLRRHRDWASIRPRAFDAALSSLRATYACTVADIDPDLEGQEECGSIDVEERNLMGRSVVREADLVVVTIAATLSGLVRGATIIESLLRAGTEPGRILPTVTRAPRSPRQRAEVTRALAALAEPIHGLTDEVPSPVFVPERRNLDDFARDHLPLPRSLVTPLGTVVSALVDRAGPVPRHRAEPQPITPGTLGSWSPDPD